MNAFNLIGGVSDTLYHADRTSLSSTGARKILACPARFKWERDHPPTPTTAAFDFGKLAHTLVLGEGCEVAVLDPAVHGLKADGEPADNPRSTAGWKRADAEARERGALPVHLDDYNAAKAMLDSVMAHPVASELFRDGLAEQSGWWKDELTDVTLRFRPDFLTELSGPVCVDLKTAASADPAEFMRSVARWAYHLQAAWYTAGLAAHNIDARFLFVVVEKTPPYPVSVIELDTEAMDEGHRLMRQAVDTYARCMDTGVWPAYGDDITLISLPAWALPDLEIAL